MQEVFIVLVKFEDMHYIIIKKNSIKWNLYDNLVHDGESMKKRYPSLCICTKYADGSYK